VINAAVGVIEIDRILLLDTLNDDLSKLSLSLFGERKEIRDARE